MVPDLTPEKIEAVLRRNRQERLIDYLIGGVMIAILFAVAMIIVPLIPVALREPPVIVDDVVIQTQMPVCPGDIVTFTSRVQIREAAIIGTYVAFYDEHTGLFITDATQHPPQVLPRHIPDTINRDVSFVVPNFAPGTYERVAGIVAINADTKPVFTIIPFTIADDCP